MIEGETVPPLRLSPKLILSWFPLYTNAPSVYARRIPLTSENVEVFSPTLRFDNGWLIRDTELSSK
jgi:hypothetical protein